MTRQFYYSYENYSLVCNFLTFFHYSYSYS